MRVMICFLTNFAGLPRLLLHRGISRCIISWHIIIPIGLLKRRITLLAQRNIILIITSSFAVLGAMAHGIAELTFNLGLAFLCPIRISGSSLFAFRNGWQRSTRASLASSLPSFLIASATTVSRVAFALNCLSISRLRPPLKQSIVYFRRLVLNSSEISFVLSLCTSKILFITCGIRCAYVTTVSSSA